MPRNLSWMSAEPEDEINLTDIKDNESDLFNIKGEYRNPAFTPFEIVEPKKEIDIL